MGSFRWMLALFFSMWMGLAQAQPGAVEAGSPRARFDGLLEVLSKDEAARRAFVEANFTARMIEKRGVDELVKLLGVLHEDFGDNRPLRVRATHEEFEALFKFASRDEFVSFKVKFAPPDAMIDGFATGPAAGPEPVVPATEAELPKAIERMVDEHAAKGFSGAVLVTRGGQPIVAKAIGMADREQRRANTLDTPINLGSANKMFTALVIASLVEQGKLGWKDTVGKHLPDWPQQAVREKVTIEHLLTHTSGMGAYWGKAHDEQRAELDTLAEYGDLFATDAPAGEPGKDFRYSNNGFVLLGLIAEKVTGRSYFDLVDDWVYGPAGMTHSGHHARDDGATGRAVGYLQDGKPNTPTLAARGSAAGGGYASARDLQRFAAALTGGKIVKPETLALMTSPHAQMGGPQAGYGYGFGVFTQGEKHYGHNGGAPGINASFEIFPDSGYVVIVLSNVDRGANELAQKIGQTVMSRTRG